MGNLENINNFIKEVEHLKDAKELLDEILVAYDIYGQEFNNSSLFDKDGLNRKVRKYLDFDDSE